MVKINKIMKYYKIQWIHLFNDEPITIYSEVDKDMYETRKIEIYKDGKIGYAYEKIEFQGAGLSETPFPPLQELNGKDEHEELITSEITAGEFEDIWNDKVVPLLKDL